MRTLTIDVSLKEYAQAFVIGTKEHAAAIAQLFSVETCWLENPTMIQRLLHGGMTARNCVIAVIGSQEHAYAIGLWRNVSRNALNFLEVDQSVLASVRVVPSPETEKITVPTTSIRKSRTKIARPTPPKHTPKTIRVVAVMPTYNQREFIEDAVESIANQVNFFIVVNDGSTDGTAEYLKSKAFPPHETKSIVHTIAHTQNRGTAEAINTGIQLATTITPPGTDLWLTWVSSDNVYKPNWRKMMEAAILADPSYETGAVYSGFIYKKPGKRDRPLSMSPADGPPLIDTLNCFYGPSFLIRSDVWRPHRGKLAHDYDNWLRVEEKCWALGLKIAHVPEALCVYNAHDKRASVVHQEQFDAQHWQDEAKKRR